VRPRATPACASLGLTSAGARPPARPPQIIYNLREDIRLLQTENAALRNELAAVGWVVRARRGSLAGPHSPARAARSRCAPARAALFPARCPASPLRSHPPTPSPSPSAGADYVSLTSPMGTPSSYGGDRRPDTSQTVTSSGSVYAPAAGGYGRWSVDGPRPSTTPVPGFAGTRVRAR
jgi:hypothetical protein